ncbi:MAG: DUF192 domain-containing protein [Rhodospirillales bacterium]|nr:DUF192 domain-containing protein [Rhodospirillales bacterium]
MFGGRIYPRVRRGFVARFVFAAALALTAFVQDASADEIRFERSALTVATARGEHRFRVELALEPAQRERGLQHRPFLAEDAGMLFVFDRPGAVDMWMLNTLIPLDMMFIAADGRIVNIAERTRPKSLDIISSAGPVLAVLEVLGGTSARLGIRPGDRVVHPLLTRR